MNQRILVGAVLVSGGRVLMTANGEPPQWHLVEGELLSEHPDTETAMDIALERFGLSAPAVEEDFLDTIVIEDGDTRTIFNLYAPTDWTGEPTHPEGRRLSWVEPTTLPTLAMNERVRDALLTLFGLKARGDDHAAILEALEHLDGPRHLRQAGGPPRIPQGTAEEFEGALAAAKLAAGLPPRETALLSLALAAAAGALGNEDVEGALAAGVTPSQAGAALRLVAVYAGSPAALAAATVLETVLRKHSGGGIT
ncbi:MAG: carboxymuconolactone decarboxylase family protein [Dehalococcoidia bacterium]